MKGSEGDRHDDGRTMLHVHVGGYYRIILTRNFCLSLSFGYFG